MASEIPRFCQMCTFPVAQFAVFNCQHFVCNVCGLLSSGCPHPTCQWKENKIEFLDPTKPGVFFCNDPSCSKILFRDSEILSEHQRLHAIDAAEKLMKKRKEMGELAPLTAMTTPPSKRVALAPKVLLQEQKKKEENIPTTTTTTPERKKPRMEERSKKAAFMQSELPQRDAKWRAEERQRERERARAWLQYNEKKKERPTTIASASNSSNKGDRSKCGSKIRPHLPRV